MVRSLTKRGLPKPFAILVAALMALYFVPFAALPAQAADAGGFEIEGNLVDDATPGIDWASLSPGTAGFATAVDNTTTSGQDATTFKGASKEYNSQTQSGGWPGWQFGSGNAAGKSDFGRWATYNRIDSSDHLWFYLGFDRGSGTGTAKYAFELNQMIQDTVTDPNPTRSQGDLRLIVWDQGNGTITLTGDSQNTDVGLYKWVDPDQPSGGVAEDTNDSGHWVKTTNGGTFVGASNTGATPVAVPSWWTSGNVSNGGLGKDQFLEFGIDLTSFGAVLGCPSRGFTAANARSITGTGGPGTLVDYLQALPVTIPSTCTSLVTHATDKVVIGNSISDTATITPSNATGTVTFKVYGPDDEDCSSAPAATLGPVTVSGGTASSGPYAPTAVGTYRWIASYDSNDEARFADSTGECNDPNESSVVVKKQPSISTDAEDEAQLLSNNPSIHDVATVSDLTSDATGTVTFKVYGPDDSDCSKQAVFTDSKPLGTVSGGTATVTSGAYTPTSAGTYRWVASYSGDDKNKSVSGACNDANESSVVLKTSPTITTDADDEAKLPKDNTIDDKATLTGVTSNAGGTITFKLFGPDTGTPTCTDGPGGNLVFTSSAVTVNGPGTYGPVSTTVDKAGTYYWIAYYSGDANNSPVAGECGDPDETSEVDKASPTIVTSATNAQLPSVTTISDTATLGGLTSDAGGTVTFNVWGPYPKDSVATCAGDPFATKVAAVSGVGADNSIQVGSGNVTVSAAGKYYWVASYSGDANNHGVTGSCGDEGETSTVNPTNPTIATTATGGSLPAGSVSDRAQLTGVTASAGGTITFRLYGPSAAPSCTGTPVFTSAPVAVSGPGSYGPVSTTVADAGSYYWVASYSGDVDNNAVAGQCGDAGETSVVTKASPEISTVAVATRHTLPGTAVEDTATLTGLSANATGTVTFALYSDDDCSDLVTTLGPVAIGTVTGGSASATSPSYTGIREAGTYYFIASYSGDANNNAVAGKCGDKNEDVTIRKAKPEVSTEVPLRTVTLGPDGSDLTDTATLSGGTARPDASGSISFTLYGPFESAPTAQDCTTPLLAAHNPQSVTVTGNGTYTTPDGVRVSQVGYYTWLASYSGDDNNESATHACGLASETVQVLPRQPVVSTQVSATSLVIAGQGSVSFSDQATISEATNTAGGTVSFTLYGPGATVEAACATTGAVQGSPVAVSGNGTYQGPTVSVSTPGYYSWVASYSGDANNQPASHACGLPSETVRVFSGPNPTLQKVADPPTGSTVQRGDLITYIVTVGNTGDVAIDKGVVTDTLPAYVTADQPSVAASGGTYTAGGDRTVSSGVIKWTVDLAPGQTKTFTYKVTVDADAPELATLVNLAEFFGIQRTTTHRVPAGDLTVAKEVSPVAGNGVVVEFGDELTYTLTATASGEQRQTKVVVTDYVPGSDPARPGSGATTYVPGSATCIGSGTCTVTGPGADGLITWSLGTMAPGTTRQVTFKVTIDEVAGEPGEVVAVDILNAGAVASTETPRNPSNEVVTPVTAVFPVKVAQPPAPGVLPRTGSQVGPGPLLATAVGLLGLGLVLMSSTRRRGAHRRR
jgi:uncharacterized repeat protein (TIGR01451 family)